MTSLFNKIILSIIFNFIFIIFSFSQDYVDSSDVLTVTKIELIGNKVTKDEIIYRELLFNEGDKVLITELQSLISRSKENLLNTALFNFVTIKYIEDLNGINIFIEFQERWYIWLYPVLEHADRNFSSFLKNEEWSRIDYGLFLLINNFRGRKETLILKTIFGHNNRYNMYYYKPFIDKHKKLGFGFDIDYIQNHEVAVQIANDKIEYLKLTREYSRKTLKISNFYTYRPRHNTDHLLNFKFTKVYLSDSVVALNNNYFFDNKSEISFFTVSYDIDYDTRDSKIYPLNGFRAYFSAVKNGLGILSDKGNLELKSIIEENYQFADKFFVNTSVLGEININNSNSFYFLRSLGYDNYIRGMEYYVSNGENYYISKTNLKYEIIPQTIFDLKFIPSKKFSKAHYAFYL